MNIAVFLPNWIGDAVMATPAIMALRRKFVDAQLIGIMKPYIAGALEGNQWFDETILANDGTWKRGIFAISRQLRRHNIDLAILFPNSFRSAITARLGGCRKRVGYARDFRRWLLTDVLSHIVDEQGQRKPLPVIDAYNRLVEHVGCPSPGYRMKLFTTERDEFQADVVWQRTGMTRYREVICFNPGGAFGAGKYWPWEYFAKLAQRLTAERNCGVLVLCGPSEKEMCQRIVNAANRHSVQGLASFPLSLGLSKACVKRCSLLITTDSGPRHFAAAFQRPVVSLFGPTHIEWTETYQPLALHLQKETSCGPCQQRVCPLGHHRCMKDLMPDEVYWAAIRLLQRAKQRQPGKKRSA